MPALWQSSQGPMYVRTIWVDGFRHAILSHDDPYLIKLNAKKRRPHSSASTTNTKFTTRSRNSRLNSHDDSLEDCLRKLDFVIRSDRSHIAIRPQRKNLYDLDIEHLNLTDIEPESEDEFIIKATPQPLNEFDSYRSNTSFNLTMKNLRLNRTARTEVKENTELSDRVFQWLDLAGKVNLLGSEDAERIAQPRHSWPEIQRRNYNLMKSKTAVDVRGKIPLTKACDSEKSHSGIIDRHDFYVPTSANTIENYARQSRNMKCTSRNESNAKIKETTNKTKSRELRNNMAETRHKVATERSAVEKQYADLVSKKLIPDINKSTKKQVHIFIPEVAKKLNANITSRTESLLSQKSSIVK
ncbi:uncharacterized protein LOC113513948 [Galleria mellonella]|uniref:Uncharacterized protein LOC113513948 n=1 Tax=Galleria mellonella TaxID=7137 RepID=A0ABM3MPC7_GALME|nr:uncharacterized protein LOC113513948 [Galleria mellonella]XP_052753223.1 uncharacterized protein LOC113513948 [Galleria mellonella]